MSGEIVFDIQEEIVKRLPVKSLVRFRSVCKAWKCLIDSSSFIVAHTLRQDKWQHLFVMYLVAEKAQTQYVSIVDDDTFPLQRFVQTLPLSIQLLKEPRMVGSCSGLLCLHGYYDDPTNSRKRMVVLWNPSIQKSIAIHVPGLLHPMDQSAFGFGVCPVTNDPKIVIVPQRNPLHEISSQINDPREVMVYTLSSGKWKIISSNVLSKSIKVKCFQVIDHAFMYCSGLRLVAKDNYPVWSCSLIMSFDMTSDTFQVIDLPHSLARCSLRKMFMSKRRESLVIFENKTNHYVVWKMENGGVQKSFTKLFNIVPQYVPVKALGFRKSGTLIMKMKYPYERTEIAEYDPNLELFNLLEIGGVKSISSVNSYMETLLLLGRSDCSGY